MTQRQFFFIFIMRSKGRKLKGSRMIALEFGDRSQAQQNRANESRSSTDCLACAGGLFGRSV